MSADFSYPLPALATDRVIVAELVERVAVDHALVLRFTVRLAS